VISRRKFAWLLTVPTVPETQSANLMQERPTYSCKI
jgi:hypothetical protein